MVEKDDTARTAASSAGDETNNHDEHQQTSSSEVEDAHTFQQLVYDNGDDSKWHFLSRSIVCSRPSRRHTLIVNVVLSLNELFHAQPSNSDAEAKTETGDGK